ncbi:hypothetical protein [Pseudoduganella armeniaca]|uniref:hypothetical protein n=1 Tax=Pseudoduganella armeniaca TaxID=2072590 RepID=UPI001E54A631|nr:hypothetical protein [Pseudoduganella armeniaca]
MKKRLSNKPVAQPSATGRLSIYTRADGSRVHRLSDDIAHPLRRTVAAIRRDPMVTALFGPPAHALPEV